MATTWQLRAWFAHRLSELYGTEVAADSTLLEVSNEVNVDVLERRGGDAAPIGSIARVTAERHGVIRVGSPRELTPRVLDIDELYRRMVARGIEMIDRLQGPPRWQGPDISLRQTLFRALAEPRRFRESDGAVSEGELRSAARVGHPRRIGRAGHPQAPLRLLLPPTGCWNDGGGPSRR